MGVGRVPHGAEGDMERGAPAAAPGTQSAVGSGLFGEPLQQLLAAPALAPGDIWWRLATLSVVQLRVPKHMAGRGQVLQGRGQPRNRTIRPECQRPQAESPSLRSGKRGVAGGFVFGRSPSAGREQPGELRGDRRGMGAGQLCLTSAHAAGSRESAWTGPSMSAFHPGRTPS